MHSGRNSFAASCLVACACRLVAGCSPASTDQASEGTGGGATHVPGAGGFSGTGGAAAGGAAGAGNPAGMGGGAGGSGGRADPNGRDGSPDGSGDAARDGSIVADGAADAAFACASIASTSTRPQLTSADAANDTTAAYLAQAGPLGSLTTDDWDPTVGLGNATSFKPDFTVAADGSGTHTTVQGALGAASGSSRRYILVKPGTYRELVSFSGSTPITLYGADADATKIVIVNNRSQAQGASQTFLAKSNGFQIMNLTISNDFATPASGTNIQAVALETMADKIILENVRLHGFQDTLQLMSPSATTVARVYIKNSYIEGDTDFIYGSATVVLDGCTINYLSSRRGTSAGVIIAPSTSVANDHGFLLTGCNFTADGGAPQNTVHLGRSWDTGGTTPTPNGQAVIRESVIGGHIARAAPWTAAATSGRPYSASGNRFEEYCNSGPAAQP